jgi:hypothetical protein
MPSTDGQDAHPATASTRTAGQRPATVTEIDTMIGDGRLRYLTSYFAGDQAEADFWSYEVSRLQNLRNIVLRQGPAS